MYLTLEDLQESIKAIHTALPKVVIEFAGAGSQALAWLHGLGGSSRTVLEATDRYAASSLTDLIGFEPEQFVSPEVARAMATQAYIRACELAETGTPVAGIGCTATIATDRLKRGAHNCCVAICEAQGVTIFTLTLAKGRRTRREEEALVSLLILKAVARVCHVDNLPDPDLDEEEHLAEHFDLASLTERLLNEEFNWIAVSPAGHMTPGQVWPNIALLSGAFNPLHQAHQQLAQVAAEMLEQQVYFELPLINADKAPLDLQEAQQRLAQFAGWATVILTRAPLFSQKAQFFPHSVFVLGVDTVERLAQLRFYNNDPAEMRASFETIRQAGCRFLAAGRLSDDRFLTLSDVDLPAGYRELFEEIPQEKFRMDISSTAIRENDQD